MGIVFEVTQFSKSNRRAFVPQPGVHTDVVDVLGLREQPGKVVMTACRDLDLILPINALCPLVVGHDHLGLQETL